MTRCLIVLAHPLDRSLCSWLTDRAQAAAEARGWVVDRLDLHAERFDPVLTAGERAGYYGPPAAATGDPLAARLAEADVLILVFPTWWFGFPATSRDGSIASGVPAWRSTTRRTLAA